MVNINYLLLSAILFCISGIIISSVSYTVGLSFYILGLIIGIVAVVIFIERKIIKFRNWYNIRKFIKAQGK